MPALKCAECDKDSVRVYSGALVLHCGAQTNAGILRPALVRKCGMYKRFEWFKEHNQWVDGFDTHSHRITFYDLDSPNDESGPQDGLSDHTGIVERVENDIVYTVEGNSGDSCRQCQRAVGNYEILGYGVLIP